MRKWPLKKKNNVSTSSEQTFKIAKNPGKIQQNNVKNKYNFERVLPRNNVLMKTKK